MRFLPAATLLAIPLLALVLVALDPASEPGASAGAPSIDPANCAAWTGTPTVFPTPSPTPPWTPSYNKQICNDTGQAMSDLHVVIAAPAVNLDAIAVNAPGCPGPVYGYGSPYPPSYLSVDIDWKTDCVDAGEHVSVEFVTDCVTPAPGCSLPSIECFSWTLWGQTVSAPSPAPNPPACATPTPTPTLSPCGFGPPPTHTPGPTELDAGISLQFTNGTGKAASDLHICLNTGVGGTYEVTNAQGCETPAVSHQTRGRDIDVVWPSACVDVGETFIIGVWAPGSAGVQCSYWTLFGEPLEPPCAPISTPTPTPASPTPTPFVSEPLPLTWGDLDCSDSINAVDALKTLRAAANLSVQYVDRCLFAGTEMTETQTWGDIECDGTVDAGDALQLLRHMAKLPVETEEPCPGIGVTIVIGCPECLPDPLATPAPTPTAAP